MIRKYRNSDRAALLTVFQQNIPTYFDPKELQELEGYLDEYAETYYVVEEGEILGGAGIRLVNHNTVGQVTWIFFTPQHKQKGLGTRMLNYCIKTLKETETLEKLEIRTSQLSFGFFEKFGLKVQRTEQNYWGKGLDLYVMEKWLK